MLYLLHLDRQGLATNIMERPCSQTKTEWSLYNRSPIKTQEKNIDMAVIEGASTLRQDSKPKEKNNTKIQTHSAKLGFRR